MPYTLSGLIDYVRSFVAENLPGCAASDLDITLIGQQRPFHVPIVSGPMASAAAPPADLGEQNGPRFYELMGDILEVVTAARRPLTNLAVKAALAKTGKEWSDRWIDEMLARMVKDGALDNPPNARPRGYRLPENNA